jgi:hypothetical protein
MLASASDYIENRQQTTPDLLRDSPVDVEVPALGNVETRPFVGALLE